MSTSKELGDSEPYRLLVSRLIYLCCAQPELSYSVDVLSQFMQHALEDYWEATLRLIWSLKVNPSQDIQLSSKCDLQLRGCCDANWLVAPGLGNLLLVG